MITRLSKIAQLPKSIREDLNRRLENGKQGPELLPWLNALPETKELLAEKFESRRITHQNLSEWRRGGHQDWLQQQHCREWFDRFSENETELKHHDKCGDTFEAMGRIFIYEIGQGLAALPNIKNPCERSLALQNLAREFSRLQNAYNFSRRTQLDFDKYNQRPDAEPFPQIEEEHSEPAPLGAPCRPPGPSRRRDITTLSEPPIEPVKLESDDIIEVQTIPTASEGNIPPQNRADETNALIEPTTSVSLSPPERGEGRGEGILEAQNDHGVPESHRPDETPPHFPALGSGLTPAFQPIPTPAPPTPTQKYRVHHLPIRGRRFTGIDM